MKISEFTYCGIVVKLVPDSKPHKWEFSFNNELVLKSSVKEVKATIDLYLMVKA